LAANRLFNSASIAGSAGAPAVNQAARRRTFPGGAFQRSNPSRVRRAAPSANGSRYSIRTFGGGSKSSNVARSSHSYAELRDASAACRAFPDPQRDELARGPQRNFQILDPLEFLAEFTRPGVPGTPFRRRART